MTRMSIHDRMQGNPSAPELEVDDVLQMLSVDGRPVVEQAAAVRRTAARGELGEVSLLALRRANGSPRRIRIAAAVVRFRRVRSGLPDCCGVRADPRHSARAPAILGPSLF